MSDKSTEHIGVLADTLLSSTMKYYTSTTEFNCRSDLHAHQMYVCVMDKQVKAGPHQRHISSSWSALPSSSLTVCSAGTHHHQRTGFCSFIYQCSSISAYQCKRNTPGLLPP